MGAPFARTGDEQATGAGPIVATGAAPYGVGADRAARRSPVGFARDVMVGLVGQTGGELALGAIKLLHAENLYASAALIRQVVEVEYLASIFADDNHSLSD